MVKIKVSMTIDEHVYAQFKHFCSENGMKVSTKVEQLMREATKNSSLNSFMDRK